MANAAPVNHASTPSSWAELVKQREAERVEHAIADTPVRSYGRTAAATATERASLRGLGCTESAGSIVRNTLTQHWASRAQDEQEEQAMQAKASTRMRRSVRHSSASPSLTSMQALTGEIEEQGEIPNERKKQVIHRTHQQWRAFDDAWCKQTADKEGWIGNQCIPDQKQKHPVTDPAQMRDNRPNLFAHIQQHPRSRMGDLLLEDAFVGHCDIKPQGGKKPIERPYRVQHDGSAAKDSEDELRRSITRKGRTSASGKQNSSASIAGALHWDGSIHESQHRRMKRAVPPPSASEPLSLN